MKAHASDALADLAQQFGLPDDTFEKAGNKVPVRAVTIDAPDKQNAQGIDVTHGQP